MVGYDSRLWIVYSNHDNEFGNYSLNDLGLWCDIWTNYTVFIYISILTQALPIKAMQSYAQG